VKITTVDRPYLLTFHATGQSYPLTSAEAQRLLDEYPAISATRNRVVLPGHNTGRAAERCIVQPATRGGGPAFVIERTPAAAGSCPDCGGRGFFVSRSGDEQIPCDRCQRTAQPE
jgi:hypothetical protein